MNKEAFKKQLTKEYESGIYDVGTFKEMVFDYTDQLDEPEVTEELAAHNYHGALQSYYGGGNPND